MLKKELIFKETSSINSVLGFIRDKLEEVNCYDELMARLLDNINCATMRIDSVVDAADRQQAE